MQTKTPTIYLTDFVCEYVIINGEPRADSFKVNRKLLNNEILKGEKEPLKYRLIKIFMPNGFWYNGEIYHKSKDYVYFYLY